MSFLRTFRQKYPNVFKQGSYLTTSVQSGLLMGAGDVISQVAVERKRTWNEFSAKRTLRFTCIGFFFIGPTLKKWYGFLDSKFGSTGRYAGLKKMATDQFIIAPALLASVLTLIELSQLHPIEKVKQQVKNNYKDVLITNYKIWPAVQVVNFSLVPLKFQVLVVQTVALFFNTYLSWKTQSK